MLLLYNKDTFIAANVAYLQPQRFFIRLDPAVPEIFCFLTIAVVTPFADNTYPI